MKTISFLSRFTVICNICFVLFAILGLLEQPGTANAIPGTVEKIPYLKELIILLGFPAIVINFLMCITYCILIIAGKGIMVPKWLAAINITFLVIEVYYFFLL